MKDETVAAALAARDEQIQARIRNIYRYYKDPENLAAAIYISCVGVIRKQPAS